MAEALSITLHGSTVGILEYFPDHEDYVFTFDPPYLALSSRPILGQIFEDFRPSSITTSGMPCWFANLLPQHRLRHLLASALGIETDDHFQLLRAIGSDLPGAVKAIPTEPRIPVPLRNDREASAFSLDFPPGLKFSLAGVQMKLSVRAGERGLIVPARGESGRYIAKFDDPSYPDLPRIEYATLKWGEHCGIDVPPFRLAAATEFSNLPAQIEVGNGSVFLIERFDRSGENLDERIHMEDFAQILDRPPGEPQYYGSYEQIGAILATLAPMDISQYVRRVVFTILCGNGDAHLKNWSVIYPNRRDARISPAYDIVSTILYYPADKLALTLGATKLFGEITLEHFTPLAKAIDVDAATMGQWVKESRDLTLSVWESEAHDLPFSREERRKIEAHLKAVPFSTSL